MSERTTTIPVGAARLQADLAVPQSAPGIVVFAHGSGSSRRSPRNRQVAAGLQDAGLATLLLDLLTAEEAAADERTRAHRFDIDLLAERLVGVTEWLDGQEELRSLRIGLFGASTGAAAALVAAARRQERIGPVLSRGGRPDLAGDALAGVTSPVLLVVGGRDTEVLELNRAAAERIHSTADVAVVDGAGHLFEEPGALDEVLRLAVGFFGRHLPPLGRGPTT